MPIITLTTDYGTRDQYVGALKGVILGIAPDVQLVDVTHDIEAYNVLHGAFVLWQVCPWFPAGTVHLAIVDPGVGSGRRIILARYEGQYVVAPDNGLVTLLERDLGAESVHVVEDRRDSPANLSATFHGRDVMAPVVARLAGGAMPREFGPPTERVELLPVLHRAEATEDGFRGVVLHVDRFGTLVTNIRAEQISAEGEPMRNWEVLVNGACIGPLRSTFSDVSPGEPVALMGGAGLLEIAVNRGRANERFSRADPTEIQVR